MIALVEIERIWKETAMTYFKLLSRHSLGGTEVNHENRILSLPLTFGLGIPQIQVTSVID
jgi:hypothetical protein